MKNILLFAFAMVFVFSACNSGGDKTKEATPKEGTSTETITADTTLKKEKINSVAEQLYACSMHPEIIGKMGDKCSKCGMNLTEPVK